MVRAVGRGRTVRRCSCALVTNLCDVQICRVLKARSRARRTLVRAPRANSAAPAANAPRTTASRQSHARLPPPTSAPMSPAELIPQTAPSRRSAQMVCFCAPTGGVWRAWPLANKLAHPTAVKRVASSI
eukprot:Rmarinus@m.695